MADSLAGSYPPRRGGLGEGGSNVGRPTEHKHYLHNKELRSLAGALRKNMTKAEACLWKYVLRAGMLKGYTFNRQRPVMDFIADFFCKKLWLVVEVDGVTHHQEESYLKDRLKEEELERAGFHVVRFTNEEVLSNIEGVRLALESCVEQREKQLRRLKAHSARSLAENSQESDRGKKEHVFPRRNGLET